MTHSPVLISGVSGHLGRRAVELLLEENVGPIIATTRTPNVQKDLAAKGVDVRFADFDDPASIAKAFIGARRILLISTGIVDGTGRRVLQHQNAIDAAKQIGAEHLVYTSFLKAHDSPLALIAADHAATEKMLEESGLGYTILRNAFYAEMLFVSLPRATVSGQIYSAAGSGRIAYVTREDCARAAGAALVSEFQGKRVLDITGPAAICSEELARIASGEFGKAITSVPVTAEDLQRRLIAAGMPLQMAQILVGIDRGVSDGAMDVESEAFQQLTGRNATSIADFLSTHRDVFLGAAQQTNVPGRTE